ncbi:MAG TPA: glutathione S-transferase N-terminal domain-containing protein [Cellvibrionaceae bacterium]|nr:glutathione S-transferase N-terminal domain-containing protein [Cellvibrionaceae bacterium]HMW72523.1 glutathione S-transferase N-terminal domain-containing protein [Cellvibrionaceae bacterium]HMY38248.1 glutathione S-transferase N-terminal domain-containing protein [Marinagarivorans sp.]HNG61711.1 glutathione S-transferase N-terminal domain-containing protein [Cellvibrionaceae bacterium]
MRIHYSITSPFARKVRIFAALTQEPNIQWVLTKPMETPDFRSINPLGKIPALQTDAITLFDSALICEYLDELHCARGGASVLHRGQADYFIVQKNHYLANGIMEAAVASVMDQRRPDASASAFWLKRWQDSIEAGLKVAAVDALGTKGNLNIGGIAMVCALGYLALRLPELNPAAINPELAAWYAAQCQEPWFLATVPQD